MFAVGQTLVGPETSDFHRVNVVTTITFNNLQGTGRTVKSLKTQLAHNKASPIVRELCAGFIPLRAGYPQFNNSVLRPGCATT